MPITRLLGNQLTPVKDEGEGNELFVLLNESTGES